jgi:hypothetical protein
MPGQPSGSRPPAWLLVRVWGLTGLISAVLAHESLFASGVIPAVGGLATFWTWPAVVPAEADDHWVDEHILRALIGAAPMLISIGVLVVAVWS